MNHVCVIVKFYVTPAAAHAERWVSVATDQS